MERPAIKRNFTLNPAVIRFHCNKDQPLFFAGFRRLAAKKALASSKNSFSSFKRRIPDFFILLFHPIPKLDKPIIKG